MVGVGSVVKSMLLDTEEEIKEGINRKMRKELVVCVHNAVGKKILLVQFEDGQKKDIISCSLQ